jgi:ribosome assembly protein YihI (activator of Der GTPase)
MEHILDVVEKITLLDKSNVRECMDRIEQLMRASLPPSPAGSPGPDHPDRSHSPEPNISSCPEDDTTTPTKVLDVAQKYAK